MGKLKGFYFSLDAMTASMILLATATMLLGFTQEVKPGEKPVELDKLHTASMQNINNWNESYNSRKTVLGYIYQQHLSGSNPETVCDNYFNISKNYALYFSNSTDRVKVCGDYSPTNSDQLAVEETITPDLRVNSSFKGSYNAVMVVQD